MNFCSGYFLFSSWISIGINKCTVSLSTESCTWGKKEDTFIHAHDKKTLANVDLAGCKQACIAERTFICRAIEYRPGTCILSGNYTLTIHPQFIKKNETFDLYERFCGELLSFFVRKYSDEYI